MGLSQKLEGNYLGIDLKERLESFYQKPIDEIYVESAQEIHAEDAEMMNVQEVARLIEWLRTSGMDEAEINDCVTYIATGVGLPTKEPVEEK